jgi:hypothetical protein
MILHELAFLVAAVAENVADESSNLKHCIDAIIEVRHRAPGPARSCCSCTAIGSHNLTGERQLRHG